MNMRTLLVAVSTAAILAGSSYGALAKSKYVAKGEAHSGILVVSHADPINGHHGKSQEGSTVIVLGGGEAEATSKDGTPATAEYGAGGGGKAGEIHVEAPCLEVTASFASAHGGASGSASAGNVSY